MIDNGEILQLCDRRSHQIAKVAVRINNIFEVVNVELTRREFETMTDGTMPANEKGKIVQRALTAAV